MAGPDDDTVPEGEDEDAALMAEWRKELAARLADPAYTADVAPHPSEMPTGKPLFPEDVQAKPADVYRQVFTAISRENPNAPEEEVAAKASAETLEIVGQRKPPRPDAGLWEQAENVFWGKDAPLVAELSGEERALLGITGDTTPTSAEYDLWDDVGDTGRVVGTGLRLGARVIDKGYAGPLGPALAGHDIEGALVDTLGIKQTPSEALDDIMYDPAFIGDDVHKMESSTYRLLRILGTGGEAMVTTPLHEAGRKMQGLLGAVGALTPEQMLMADQAEAAELGEPRWTSDGWGWGGSYVPGGNLVAAYLQDVSRGRGVEAIAAESARAQGYEPNDGTGVYEGAVWGSILLTLPVNFEKVPATAASKVYRTADAGVSGYKLGKVTGTPAASAAQSAYSEFVATGGSVDGVAPAANAMRLKLQGDPNGGVAAWDEYAEAAPEAALGADLAFRSKYGRTIREWLTEQEPPPIVGATPNPTPVKSDPLTDETSQVPENTGLDPTPEPVRQDPLNETLRQENQLEEEWFGREPEVLPDTVIAPKPAVVEWDPTIPPRGGGVDAALAKAEADDVPRAPTFVDGWADYERAQAIEDARFAAMDAEAKAERPGTTYDRLTLSGRTRYEYDDTYVPHDQGTMPGVPRPADVTQQGVERTDVGSAQLYQQGGRPRLEQQTGEQYKAGATKYLRPGARIPAVSIVRPALNTPAGVRPDAAVAFAALVRHANEEVVHVDDLFADAPTVPGGMVERFRPSYDVGPAKPRDTGVAKEGESFDALPAKIAPPTDQEWDGWMRSGQFWPDLVAESRKVDAHAGLSDRRAFLAKIDEQYTNAVGIKQPGLGAAVRAQAELLDPRIPIAARVGAVAEIADFLGQTMPDFTGLAAAVREGRMTQSEAGEAMIGAMTSAGRAVSMEPVNAAIAAHKAADADGVLARTIAGKSYLDATDTAKSLLSKSERPDPDIVRQITVKIGDGGTVTEAEQMYLYIAEAYGLRDALERRGWRSSPGRRARPTAAEIAAIVDRGDAKLSDADYAKKWTSGAHAARDRGTTDLPAARDLAKWIRDRATDPAADARLKALERASIGEALPVRTNEEASDLTTQLRKVIDDNPENPAEAVRKIAPDMQAREWQPTGANDGGYDFPSRLLETKQDLNGNKYMIVDNGKPIVRKLFALSGDSKALKRKDAGRVFDDNDVLNHATSGERMRRPGVSIVVEGSNRPIASWREVDREIVFDVAPGISDKERDALSLFLHANPERGVLTIAEEVKARASITSRVKDRVFKSGESPLDRLKKKRGSERGAFLMPGPDDLPDLRGPRRIAVGARLEPVAEAIEEGMRSYMRARQGSHRLVPFVGNVMVTAEERRRLMARMERELQGVGYKPGDVLKVNEDGSIPMTPDERRRFWSQAQKYGMVTPSTVDVAVTPADTRRLHESMAREMAGRGTWFGHTLRDMGAWSRASDWLLRNASASPGVHHWFMDVDGMLLEKSGRGGANVLAQGVHRLSAVSVDVGHRWDVVRGAGGNPYLMMNGVDAMKQVFGESFEPLSGKINDIVDEVSAKGLNPQQFADLQKRILDPDLKEMERLEPDLRRMLAAGQRDPAKLPAFVVAWAARRRDARRTYAKWWISANAPDLDAAAVEHVAKRLGGGDVDKGLDRVYVDAFIRVDPKAWAPPPSGVYEKLKQFYRGGGALQYQGSDSALGKALKEQPVAVAESFGGAVVSRTLGRPALLEDEVLFNFTTRVVAEEVRRDVIREIVNAEYGLVKGSQVGKLVAELLYSTDAADTAWALSRGYSPTDLLDAHQMIEKMGLQAGSGKALVDVSRGGGETPVMLAPYMAQMLDDARVYGLSSKPSNLAVRYWKTNALGLFSYAYSPSYIIGNTLSAFMQVFLTRGGTAVGDLFDTALPGHGAYALASSLAEMRARKWSGMRHLANAGAKDVFVFPSGVWTHADLVEAMSRRGVDAQAARAENAAQIIDDSRRHDYGIGRQIIAFDDHIQVANELNNWVDMQFRVRVALGELKRGATMDEACRAARESLYDYSGLTKFERDYMRGVFPFYTFIKRNQQAVWKALLENPERVAYLAGVAFKQPDLWGMSDRQKMDMRSGDWSKIILGKEPGKNANYDAHLYVSTGVNPVSSAGDEIQNALSFPLALLAFANMVGQGAAGLAGVDTGLGNVADKALELGGGLQGDKGLAKMLLGFAGPWVGQPIGEMVNVDPRTGLDLDSPMANVVDPWMMEDPRMAAILRQVFGVERLHLGRGEPDERADTWDEYNVGGRWVVGQAFDGPERQAAQLVWRALMAGAGRTPERIHEYGRAAGFFENDEGQDTGGVVNELMTGSNRTDVEGEEASKSRARKKFIQRAGEETTARYGTKTLPAPMVEE